MGLYWAWPLFFEWVKIRDITVTATGGEEVDCKCCVVTRRSHSQCLREKPPGYFEN